MDQNELDGIPLSRFAHPAVRLSGTVDQAMYDSFRTQMEEAGSDDLVVIEIATLGGDPEIARMMGADVRFLSEIEPERKLVFLGKTMVYSAGATFMSFFPVERRYLTRCARLMIHERKLTKEVKLDGPLETLVAPLKAALAEIETSISIEREGFAALVEGSRVTLDEVIERAPCNWYICAKEALERGLVCGII